MNISYLIKDSNQLIYDPRLKIIKSCLFTVPAMKYLRNCHLVAVILLSTKFLLASCQQWTATFEPSRIEVETNLDERVRVVLSNLPDYARSGINNRDIVRFQVQHLQDWEVAGVNQNEVVFTQIGTTNAYAAEITVNGIFIGKHFRIQCILVIFIPTRCNQQVEGPFSWKSDQLQIPITRHPRIFSK